MNELLKVMKSEPAYRKLAAANFVSGIGDWFSSVAILSLLLQLTGSGMAVGITLAARTLPFLAMGPIGGMLADRRNKKAILVVSDFSRIGLALSLLLVDSPDRVWIAYAATVGLVVFSALSLPARQALIPRIVRAENLQAANAFDQSLAGMNMTLGAMLGGAASAAFGPQWSFLLNAATFLASGLLVWRMPYGEPGQEEGRNAQSPKGAGRNVRTARGEQARQIGRAREAEQIRKAEQARSESDFWKTFRRLALMRVVAVQSVAWPIGGGAINVLISVYGYQVFGAGDRGVGLLYGCLGIGFILGGLLAPYFKRWPVQVLIAGAAAEGLAHILVSAAPNLALGGAFILLATLGGGVGNTALATLIMRAVPERVHGRAFALNETLSNVTMGVSMLAAGVLLDVLPARTIGLGAGLLIVLSCIPALTLLPQRRELNAAAGSARPQPQS
ncbi:MFS transporter [Saccharibacillus alkalitolerans]|uniref:MFS transporter n=1 Tax=Saccharibacillus alkalitolerans TaxID=2705290 RepID=A0ABX0F6I5_9BACL|nr:MFS transporter [Saccharibacillus alkalitolerans]NGZ75213.1 MFS transporter [Saccharibacillus alkalitolerans]